MSRMLSGRTRFALAVAVAACLTGTSHAGSIKGTVKYDGPVPASMKQPIQMNADPACALKHKSAVMPEALVLGPGQTLGNAFVYVKSGVPEKQYPVPAEPVTIDQNGCLYSPHVMGIMIGQTLKILNSDGLLHNVHALPAVNQQFNRAMPANVKEAEFKFTKEEPMFKVKCDVHPWMGAYIQVMKHPFFAVTKQDGTFNISGLGPGTYEVEVWHEKLKTKTATVKISGDEAQTADFTFTPPQKGTAGQ
jgi:plastocyanin